VRKGNKQPEKLQRGKHEQQRRNAPEKGKNACKGGEKSRRFFTSLDCQEKRGRARHRGEKARPSPAEERRGEGVEVGGHIVLQRGKKEFVPIEGFIKNSESADALQKGKGDSGKKHDRFFSKKKRGCETGGKNPHQGGLREKRDLCHERKKKGRTSSRREGETSSLFFF